MARHCAASVFDECFIEAQVDRLRSDLASNVVEMAQGKIQAELGVKVAKAADEVLGTLIDTYA